MNASFKTSKPATINIKTNPLPNVLNGSYANRTTCIKWSYSANLISPPTLGISYITLKLRCSFLWLNYNFRHLQVPSHRPPTPYESIRPEMGPRLRPDVLLRFPAPPSFGGAGSQGLDGLVLQDLRGVLRLEDRVGHHGPRHGLDGHGHGGKHEGAGAQHLPGHPFTRPALLPLNQEHPGGREGGRRQGGGKEGGREGGRKEGRGGGRKQGNNRK